MNDEAHVNDRAPEPANPAPQAGGPAPDASKKIVAGICGILLGSLGVHKFILGYTKEGVIMLVASLVGGIFTCGVASAVIGVIGLVEGIMYLTKSDEEFVSTYITGQKPWF